MTLSQRLKRILTSDVAPLTVEFMKGIMAKEYAYSVAGEEDTCNRI